MVLCRIVSVSLKQDREAGFRAENSDGWRRGELEEDSGFRMRFGTVCVELEGAVETNVMNL